MKFKEVIYSLLTENQEGVYKKYFSDVERKTFIRIADADPKTKIVDDKIIRLGSYYPFLINMYKTEEGYVQVDNLINHMQIEPLFERLSFKLILKSMG